MSKKEKYYFKQWCIDNHREDILNRWDYEKTGFSPEDITYSSAKTVYFKCPNGIHESEPKNVYRITSKSADQHNFICKECEKDISHKTKDLIGQKFGELTVIEFDRDKTKEKQSAYWVCRCSCGKIKSISASHLKNGLIVTCGDRSVHRIGEKNSNWKGGKTPELLSKRTSNEYKEWRDKVYAKDWYTCQCCGAYGDSVEKNAHHILNFSEYADLEYDVSNGICLCSMCHHIKNIGSFHNIYGIKNNTPEQLEEYINQKRKQLGINIPFSIEEYKLGNILKPDNIPNPYVVINKETNLCHFSIPLEDAELIWGKENDE